MQKKQADKLKKFSNHIGTMVAIVTGLSTLVGAGLAACNWAVEQVNAQSNQRIDQLQENMAASQREQELAITRIELMQLMQHDPENIVAIERTARHYFKDLGGDSWMSERYSRFAKENGLDASFVVD